ncbi:MAG: NAD(P)H-binding protein [Pontixanthobacter sp.]
MSKPLRVAIVGATGLIGRSIIEQALGREDIRLLAIARREIKLPKGSAMEMVVASPGKWGDVLARVKPQVLVNALGTTIKKVGSEDAFRAVDQQLVVQTARAALENGVTRMISVSSVGADAYSKNFYLKVKGEVERDLLKIGFGRLDILRPGLLRGERLDDPRLAERTGMILSPLADLMMHGKFRKYRSISAKQIADAILALSMRKAAGKFFHEHDALIRAAHSLPQIHSVI